MREREAGRLVPCGERWIYRDSGGEEQAGI